VSEAARRYGRLARHIAIGLFLLFFHGFDQFRNSHFWVALKMLPAAIVSSILVDNAIRWALMAKPLVGLPRVAPASPFPMPKLNHAANNRSNCAVNAHRLSLHSSRLYRRPTAHVVQPSTRVRVPVLRRIAMSTFLIPVSNGPDKVDLLCAVANPYRYATFSTQEGAIEARIDLIEEQGTDGVGFTVWGCLASSNLRGAFFTGTYNCQTRTGRLALKKVA
jgi:hypothetical protein